MLQTAASFNFEVTSSYSIRVRTTDAAGSGAKAFTINVTDANEQPNDIALSNTSIAENQPAQSAASTDRSRRRRDYTSARRPATAFTIDAAKTAAEASTSRSEASSRSASGPPTPAGSGRRRSPSVTKRPRVAEQQQHRRTCRRHGSTLDRSGRRRHSHTLSRQRHAHHRPSE